MRLQLITFDLDDTLWESRPVLLEAERVWIDWLAGAFPHFRAQLSREALAAVRDQLVTSRSDYLDRLTALRQDTAEQALCDLGVEPAGAREVAHRAFAVFHAARSRVTPFASVRPLLEELRHTYTVGVLTNGNADLGAAKLDHLFHFHHSAETVGRRKPAPDMFLAALQSADTVPAQAVHVGDSPVQDVEAARRVGFHAVWVRRPDRVWPSDLAPPEHVVEDLSELNALLGQLNTAPAG